MKSKTKQKYNEISEHKPLILSKYITIYNINQKEKAVVLTLNKDIDKDSDLGMLKLEHALKYLQSEGFLLEEQQNAAWTVYFIEKKD